jgi:hypothetical protein
MFGCLEVPSHDAVAAGEAMPLGRQSNDSLAANAGHVQILHRARVINRKLPDLSSQYRSPTGAFGNCPNAPERGLSV